MTGIISVFSFLFFYFGIYNIFPRKVYFFLLCDLMFFPIGMIVLETLLVFTYFPKSYFFIFCQACLFGLPSSIFKPVFVFKKPICLTLVSSLLLCPLRSLLLDPTCSNLDWRCFWHCVFLVCCPRTHHWARVPHTFLSPPGCGHLLRLP